MSRPRFIAGATCPACGSLDRILVERNESGVVRRCVDCGDRQVLDSNASDEPHAVTRERRIIARSSLEDDR